MPDPTRREAARAAATQAYANYYHWLEQQATDDFSAKSFHALCMTAALDAYEQAMAGEPVATVVERMRQLCYAIEDVPAGAEQTRASVMASDLLRDLNAGVALTRADVERVVAITAPLARMESGAMGEDGWWYATDEALADVVWSRLTEGRA